MTDSDKPKPLHPIGLTSLADASKIYSMSTSTLRRRWKKGLFPRPVKIESENKGNAKNYFKNSDLIEYSEKLEYEEVT